MILVDLFVFDVGNVVVKYEVIDCSCELKIVEVWE